MFKISEDENRVKMTWGKHKDEYLDGLPSSYLYWLSCNCDWDEMIQSAADEEWYWRDENNEHSE